LARSASTASVLQGKLTERGLVRVLGSHGVAPAIVQHYSPDEAARRLQRRLGPSIVRKAEKKTAVCTENVIRVDDVTESLKLAE
jgi:hypothetical protein